MWYKTLNSEYTTKLANIDVNDIFDFEFEMYGADDTEKAQHKANFIDRFYKYYYFREVNADTLFGFNRRLEEIMNEWLPRFNFLFEKQSNVVENEDIFKKTRVETKGITGTISDTFDTITNEHTSKFLDTPQSPYGSTDVDKYATSLSKDNNDVNTTNERELDTLETINHGEQDNIPIENLDVMYKKYHDLDMDLIRKFKDCFLKIY